MTATLTIAPLDPFGHEVPEPTHDLKNPIQVHRAFADDRRDELIDTIAAAVHRANDRRVSA